MMKAPTLHRENHSLEMRLGDLEFVADELQKGIVKPDSIKFFIEHLTEVFDGSAPALRLIDAKAVARIIYLIKEAECSEF